MTENQDPKPTADAQAPDAADTHGTIPADETEPSDAAPEREAVADTPPADEGAPPEPAASQDTAPADESPAPADASSEAEPETVSEDSELAAAESPEEGGQEPPAGESKRIEPERREAGRAEAPQAARGDNPDPASARQAEGNPQRITIPRNKEQGVTTAEPEKPADAQDSNKRITFGIRRNRDAAAVVDEAKQWDDHFPTKQSLIWQPNTRGGAKGSNGKGEGREVAVVVTQEVLLEVSRHVAQTLEHEIGGFLIGDHCRCPETGREFIVINNTSPAKMADATEVSHNFTVESWSHLNAEMKNKFRGKLLVGWYHSHPRMDVFLSRYDMDIQSERFGEPWMTALVLEPERHRGGFFGWRDGAVNPTEPVEFFELLERNSRESVVAWENYTGFDPVAFHPPRLKRVNTLTVRTPEQFPEPEAEPDQPGGDGAVTVINPPPPPTRLRKLLPWLVIVAAVFLLAFAAVAFVRMQDDTEPSVDGPTVAEATPAPTAGDTRQPDAPGVEIIPVDPVAISKIETYELVKGRDNTFRVKMLVDNAPSKIQVELGDRRAKVTGNRKMAGGENRREVLADVSFAREVALMKRRPDAPMPLLVKVSDEEDPANYEVQELEVDPSELGLEGAGKVAAKGPVTVASGKAHKIGGTPGKVVKPKKPPGKKPGNKAAGTGQAAADGEGGTTTTHSGTGEVRPREVKPNPPAQQPTPRPRPTPKPCNWVQRALKLC